MKKGLTMKLGVKLFALLVAALLGSCYQTNETPDLVGRDIRLTLLHALTPDPGRCFSSPNEQTEP